MLEGYLEIHSIEGFIIYLDMSTGVLIRRYQYVLFSIKFYDLPQSLISACMLKNHLQYLLLVNVHSPLWHYRVAHPYCIWRLEGLLYKTNFT